MDIIHSDINRIKGRHSRESGNPDDVPAEAGNHHSGIWIPPYQVRGRLSQARNDKLHNTYMVIYRNQSGAALVIALVMMIVLTLIGLASIFTSTFEMRLSGNKRGSTNAFYAADSGIQVVGGRVENFVLSSYNPSTHEYNPFTDPANTAYINPPNVEVTITDLVAQKGAPRGFGFSAVHLEFEHFMVDSTGRDQLDTTGTKSTCRLQERMVRILPVAQ
jgi:hypothetical protein